MGKGRQKGWRSGSTSPSAEGGEAERMGHRARGWAVSPEHRRDARRDGQGCDLAWGRPEEQGRPGTLQGCHKPAFPLEFLVGLEACPSTLTPEDQRKKHSFPHCFHSPRGFWCTSPSFLPQPQAPDPPPTHLPPAAAAPQRAARTAQPSPAGDRGGGLGGEGSCCWGSSGRCHHHGQPRRGERLLICPGGDQWKVTKARSDGGCEHPATEPQAAGGSPAKL